MVKANRSKTHTAQLWAVCSVNLWEDIEKKVTVL